MEELVYMKWRHLSIDLLVLEGERGKWKVSLDSAGNRRKCLSKVKMELN